MTEEMNAEQLSVEELYEQISHENNLFLLDVRNVDEYEASKIEGRFTPETVNVPYFDFFDEDNGAINKVPRDREIVVLCAKGGASDFIVTHLEEEGIASKNIAGGMIDWGNYYKFKPIEENDNFSLYQVDRVARGCLSYVLISNGEAVIIDPLRHIEKYIDFLKEKGAELKLIFDTHGHADHISGGPALRDETGAPYYLHPYDGIHPFDILPPDVDFEFLKDGDKFSVGEMNITSLHVPGHTLGQVNFLVSAPTNSYFFSGDTLFIESFGRPDLGGQGEKWAPIVYETIYNTIRNNVPGEAYLLPGHYAQAKEANDDGLFMSRMAELWEENSALQFTKREDFIQYVLDHLPTLPEQYIEIKRVNAGLSNPDEEAASELELGKNICALSEAYE